MRHRTLDRGLLDSHFAVALLLVLMGHIGNGNFAYWRQGGLTEVLELLLIEVRNCLDRALAMMAVAILQSVAQSMHDLRHKPQRCGRFPTFGHSRSCQPRRGEVRAVRMPCLTRSIHHSSLFSYIVSWVLPVSGTSQHGCGKYHVAESLEREARPPREQERDLNASKPTKEIDQRSHGEDVAKAASRNSTLDHLWRNHAGSTLGLV